MPTTRTTCRRPTIAPYVPWVAAVLAALALAGALTAALAVPDAHDLAPRHILTASTRSIAL